jgi:hypothetical protein
MRGPITYVTDKYFFTNPSPNAFLLGDGIAQWATDWLAEELGVRFLAGARRVCLLHKVQTGSGSHLPFYPMGAGGREADNSPQSSGEVMNGGAIPPLLTRLHGVVL